MTAMTRSDLRLFVAIVSTAMVSAGAAALLARAFTPVPDTADLERRITRLEIRIAGLESVAATACTIDTCILRNFEPACCANVPRPEPVDDCDEVSCVLTDYHGACCAKFDKRPDGLDRAMITAGVAGVRGAVAACGDHFPDKGMVKLHVHVGPDGKVTKVDVATAPNPRLGDCVADAMLHTLYPSTRNGGSFSYPFVF
jgi:hypothetical protein